MAHDGERGHHSDTGRLEAFSDGVFAIAITLLILEVGVPQVESTRSLGEALRGLWPSYLGFALSFLTIGIMWINHHTMFRDIDRTDHTLMVLNLILLLCISFVPFPTAVLAAYLRDTSHALPATLAYGVTLTITAVAFNSMWLYASHGRRLIDEHVSDMRVRIRTRRYLPGAPLYAVGIPLALINVWAAVAWWIVLAVFFLLPLPE